MLAGRHGGEVTVLPLALETAIEERARLTQFQLLRLSDGRLELRLEPGVSGVDVAALVLSAQAMNRQKARSPHAIVASVG